MTTKPKHDQLSPKQAEQQFTEGVDKLILRAKTLSRRDARTGARMLMIASRSLYYRSEDFLDDAKTLVDACWDTDANIAGNA